MTAKPNGRMHYGLATTSPVGLVKSLGGRLQSLAALQALERELYSQVALTL